MHIYLTNFPNTHLQAVTSVLNNHQHTFSVLPSRRLWEDNLIESLFPYSLVMIYDTIFSDETATLYKRVKRHLPSADLWLVSSSYQPENVRAALKYGFTNYIMWSPDMQDFDEMMRNLDSYQNLSAFSYSDNVYELSQIASSLMDHQMNIDQLLSALITPGGCLSSSYLPLLLRHHELQDQHFVMVLIKTVLPLELYFRDDYDSVIHIAISETRIHLNMLLNIVPHAYQVLHSMRDNMLVCIFHSSQPNFTEDIKALLQALNERLQQYLGLSLLAGYSRPYTSLDESYRYFKNIKDNMRHVSLQKNVCCYELDQPQQYTSSTIDIDEYISKNLPLATSNNDHELFFNIINNVAKFLQRKNVAYEFARPILLQTTTRYARETDFYQLIERDFVDVTFTQAALRIPFFFQLMKLFQLLQNCYLQAYRSFFDNDSNRLTRAKQFIKENYDQKITLQLIAEHLSLTPNYFCGWFKKRTGKNFFDVVTEYRINAAKEYLTNTDRKICDIAVEVGYPEVVSFNRSFKKEVGTPPSEYRRLTQLKGREN